MRVGKRVTTRYPTVRSTHTVRRSRLRNRLFQHAPDQADGEVRRVPEAAAIMNYPGQIRRELLIMIAGRTHAFTVVRLTDNRPRIPVGNWIRRIIVVIVSHATRSRFPAGEAEDLGHRTPDA